MCVCGGGGGGRWGGGGGGGGGGLGGGGGGLATDLLKSVTVHIAGGKLDPWRSLGALWYYAHDGQLSGQFCSGCQ